VVPFHSAGAMQKRSSSRDTMDPMEKGGLLSSGGMEPIDLAGDHGYPSTPSKSAESLGPLLNKRNLFLMTVAGIVVLICELFAMASSVPDEPDGKEDAGAAETAAGLAIVASLCALAFSMSLTKSVLAQPTGNTKMMEIASAIQEGSQAFLKREYTWLTVFVVIVAGLMTVGISPATAMCFVCGAALSAFTGYLGMSIAVRGNVRTTAAAVHGLQPALRVAFNTGTVMGMLVVGFGLLGLSFLFLVLNAAFGSEEAALTALAGFGFGASSIALFARVGGGIYTKAADVGADLVGKVEAGIPEDDPRNPATIADNVGDNVGDVAGMGADLFESYVGSIVAAATLGIEAHGSSGVALPIYIAAIGIICSIIGTFFVRTQEGASQEDLLKSMHMGTLSSSFLIVLALGVLVPALGFAAPLKLFFTIVVGLVAGALIGHATEYATSHAYYPTQSIAKASETGPATVLI